MNYLINAIRILFLAVFLTLILNGKMVLWLAIYVISLPVALLFGRVYCGYLCPMNTLMIPTDSLAKKMNLQTETSPKWLGSGNFGWFALIASLLIMIPFKRILGKNLPILLIWLFVSILVTIRYKTSVFHNLICAFGKLQKLFGKFAIFSERVDKEKCIGCRLCEGDCPSDAIRVKEDKKALINTALCHQCTNCQQICPKKAIAYSK